MNTQTPEPLMIMCAPNGARKTADDHPQLPITPDQLATCARDILQAGASVLHLHVRADTARHSLSPQRYRHAMTDIHAAVGDQLVIQVTTEAVGIYSREQQMAAVHELKPEAVSLALRELCPDEASVTDSAGFFNWCHRQKIWAQYILYSPAEVTRFVELQSRGVFGPGPVSVLFVLGRYSQDLTGHPQELQAFIEAWDERCGNWTCCCFGATEQQAMLLAARAGGHVRLGFENNMHLPDGRIAQDNTELLNDFISQLTPSGRALASADDIRQRFFPK
ncbi:MAG: 3-keto-5-aminohexanoate cleavage protein [Pseudohongiellaceae bacterium]